MLEKPYDIAVMFALFALVVITVGFAITDINNEEVIDHNTTFFSTIEERAGSATGLKGAGDQSATGLTGEEGTAEEASEEGFIIAGFKSLITLGQTWAIMDESMDESVRTLGIDPIYITIIASILVMAFAVTLYTWLRGK